MIRSIAYWLVVLLSVGAFLPRLCAAEDLAPVALTLEQAVEYALAHQPSLRAATATEAGTEAGVEYSRADYLPETDISAQETRASAHNVPGLFLNDPTFPVIEENQNGGAFGPTAWNSQTSLFVSKNVAGLLREMALVDVALARRERAKAGLDAQKLRVAFGAADAFMGDVAAGQTVRATQAGVTRARVFAVAVKGLVNSGLRAGADASRADAEVALALNQEILAQQAKRVARAALVEALGGIDDSMHLVTGELLKMPANAPGPDHASPVDPFLREALADMSAARAGKRAARFEYLPRLDLVAGIFQRDSGFTINAIPGPGNGLVPNTTNWAVGIVVTVPIKRLFEARAAVIQEHCKELKLAAVARDYPALCRQARDGGPAHVLAFAPTRSGKGAGIVVPTLLDWPESVVVHDIKGENWALTAGWRRRNLGNLCFRFDPTCTDGTAAHFNPLCEIRLGDEEVKDAQNIADILIDPSGNAPRDHWDLTAHDLLTAVILHVIYAEREKTLARCLNFLAPPDRSQDDALKGMIDARQPREITHAVIAGAAQAVLSKSPNERASVLSTAVRCLSLYRDPIVAANTADSHFALADLMHHERPVSLYLTVPPSDLTRTRPLMRLLLAQLGARLTERLHTHDGSPPRRRLLLMLDEFPALGRLDFLQTALSYAAGYGIKACLIA